MKSFFGKLNFMETAKFTTTEDPSIFDETSNDILGFGNKFPENPKDGFAFTLLTKGRKQQFIYDATNEVWQEVGNDSFEYFPYGGSGGGGDSGGGSESLPTLLGIFSGTQSTYSSQINTNTSGVPNFYDIGCMGLGPFASDVEVYANGSADDDLFVFEGTDPRVYGEWPSLSDKIWYAYNGHGITHSYSNQKLCTVPAGHIFSVMLVDTMAVAVVWNGTITIKSTVQSINLSQFVSDNGYNYNSYILYLLVGEMKTEVGRYSSYNLPTIDLNENNVSYEFYGV